MSKFLRIALAWLLAVALPVQGYAAQAMLMCGPAHHQSDTAHDHTSHDHGDAAEDLVDAVPLYGYATASADPSLDHHAKSVKSSHASKCSACSSCCSAAAITNSVVAVAVIPQHVPVVATIPVGNAVETVGGLERPPRPFLA
ncbi:MAG: hypothetical protein K2W93_21750 [Burkholderiaceae bacterium]|nr:hypothetical protein [Burkholderiaceae bacterium]